MTPENVSNLPPNVGLEIVLAEYFRRTDNGENSSVVRNELRERFPYHEAGLAAGIANEDQNNRQLAPFLNAKTTEERNQLLLDNPALAEAVRVFLDGLAAFASPSSPTLEHVPFEIITRSVKEHVQYGIRIGKYEIIRLVDEGGMGIVYESVDTSNGQLFAIKFSKTIAGSDPTHNARFQLEAESAMRIRHPNVVRVFEVGVFSGYQYLVMEWVNGGNLATHLSTVRLDPKVCVRIIETLARALEIFHNNGLIHRDLKPKNILIDCNGVFKIADFGLVKSLQTDATVLTNSNMIVGTPAYMSPEQALGETLTISSDVYSLGIVLYEMLTERLPFIGSPREQMQARLFTEPLPLRVKENRISWEVEAVCRKALQRNVEDRYISAAAFADDLKNILENKPIIAHGETWVTRSLKFIRRHRVALGLSSLLLMVMIAGVIGVFAQRNIAIKNAGEAQANFEEAFSLVDAYYVRVSEDARLQLTGNEELRRSLLGKAEEYYKRFVERHANDARYELPLARARWRLGMADFISGETGSAQKGIEGVRAASQVLDRFASQLPSDFALRIDSVRCRDQLATLLAQTGHPNDALESHRQCRKEFEEILKDRANDNVVVRAYLNNLHNTGVLCRRLGRLPEAITLFEVEAEHSLSLATREGLDPFVRYEHGKCLISLANVRQDVALRAKDAAAWKRALQAHEAAERFLHSLVFDYPSNPTFREALALAENNLSGCHWELKNEPLADEWYGKALVNRKRLVEEQPKIPAFRSALSQSLFNRAFFLSRRILTNASRLELESAYKEAFRIDGLLVEEFPQVSIYHVNKARDLKGLADYFRQERRFEETEKTYAEAITILTSRNGGWDDAANARELLGQSYEGRAISRIRLTRHADAASDLSEALKLMPFETRNHLGLLRCYALVKAGEYALATEETNALRVEQGSDFFMLGRVQSLCAAMARGDARLSEEQRIERSLQSARAAIDALTKAWDRNFRQIETYRNDEDLSFLRQTPPFDTQLQELITRHGVPERTLPPR